MNKKQKPEPENEKSEITHCHACGRKFGKQPKLTVAAWFFAGTPRDEDIVHWGCRFKKTPVLLIRQENKSGDSTPEKNAD